MTSTLRRGRSLIPYVGTWWPRRARRCDGPACSHPIGAIVAPTHMLQPRCTGVRWWRGCVAWLAGHCVCPSCVPVPLDEPHLRSCSCPTGESSALV